MHGRFVDAAYRSAKAWIGTYSSRNTGSDQWDEEEWSKLSSERFFADEDAVLVRQEGSFVVYEVSFSRTPDFQKWCLRNVLDGFDPKVDYPAIDQKIFRRTARLFLCTWTDPEEAELRLALGHPPNEGFLSALCVLSDADRLLPLKICWQGSEVDLYDLSGRVEQFLAWSQSVQVPTPKVSSPELPAEVLDLVESARSGQATRHERERLVDQMMSLDRVGFLETIDRLWPWIDWHDAPAGWVDKNDQVADRLWQITTDLEELSRPGVLRLAPWKTALGQPKSLEFRVEVCSRDRSTMRDRPIWIRRQVTGAYRVKALPR